MKLFKLKSIINNNLKNYLLYAVGEILLIVLGILIAMYINNWNSNNKYKKKIDNNFLRVHKELENNMKRARGIIKAFKKKDSLIYLVLNDSVKPEMYSKNSGLAYLIFSLYDLKIEDKAYQNLMALNISDNKYKEDLISKLKSLYSINKYIQQANQRMSDFVHEKAIPFSAQNTKIFTDLHYKEQVKKEAIDFFMTSQEYKAYVGQYSLIAIKTQLYFDQIFLQRAYKVYSEITEQYQLKKPSFLKKDSLISQYKGLYFSKEKKDTLTVKVRNDSIIVCRDKKHKINLFPITKHDYFVNGGGFVSFYHKNDTINMKMSRLSHQRVLKKIK